MTAVTGSFTGTTPKALDSKADPNFEGYQAFLAGETRYSSLVKTQGAEVANKLFEETEESAKERLAGYKKLAGKE